MSELETGRSSFSLQFLQPRARTKIGETNYGIYFTSLRLDESDLIMNEREFNCVFDSLFKGGTNLVCCERIIFAFILRILKW